MSFWPFRRSRAAQDADRLLAAVIEASRRPAFFGAARAPDTLEGRFEMVTIHACLALIRMRSAPDLEDVAQHFTDRLFRGFDAGLREDGVGDLTVPKRMRAMAGAFYGRLEAYAAALSARDATALTHAVGRNALGDEAHPFAPALAAYVASLAAAQAAAPAAALFEPWAQPPP